MNQYWPRLTEEEQPDFQFHLTGDDEIARRNGLHALIAPVRPSWKERYPPAPIDGTSAGGGNDGLLFDPWMRVHERVGASIRWVEYAKANGGRRYAVLCRNFLLAFTRVSMFPLTDEGWTNAWRVFESLAPHIADQVRARIVLRLSRRFYELSKLCPLHSE